MTTKAQLMEAIKKAENSDLHNMEVLCGNLLEIAYQEDDSYAIAFANTYLANSLILQRKHSACIHHLKEAQAIAEEYHFQDLLHQIYTIGGIFFKSHFDEITAVKYYLDAYNLANEQNNLDEKLMALNNIAELFAMKKDYTESLSYLKRAYGLFLKKGEHIETQQDIIVIVSLIQMYILNNQLEVAKSLYDQYHCQLIRIPHTPYSDALIALCQLYLANATKDDASVEKLTEFFLHECFKNLDNRSMTFTFYSNVFDILLPTKNRVVCEQLLQAMGETCLQEDIEQQLCLHLCWIHFAEEFHLESSLLQAYKQYYLLQKLVDELTDKTKAESMKEKILLDHMVKEREIIEHEKRVLEAKINVDELTHLFNRSYFNQLCTAMIENPGVTDLGFIIVDVDYFKEYNDHYGHFQGDQLLKRIARALDEPGDSRFFAARFGGDEFICLCVNVCTQDITNYLDSVYEQLQLAQIEHIASKASSIASISSGFAIFKNDKHFEIESALTKTDTALYQAKKKGRNCYLAYEDQKKA